MDYEKVVSICQVVGWGGAKKAICDVDQKVYLEVEKVITFNERYFVFTITCTK